MANTAVVPVLADFEAEGCGGGVKVKKEEVGEVEEEVHFRWGYVRLVGRLGWVWGEVSEETEEGRLVERERAYF